MIIVGAGGHGRTVLANFLAMEIVPGPIIFLDDKLTGTVDGYDIGGTVRDLDNSSFRGCEFIVGIGDVKIRGELSRKIKQRGGILVSSIHPSAVICQDVVIGDGTFIGPQTLIGVGTRIGQYSIVNNGATIGHFATLKDGCSVNDGSHFAGSVTVGEEAYLGIGVLVHPHVKIGDRAVIGAGTVLRYDVAPDVTVVSPMEQRVIKSTGSHGNRG